MERLDLLQNESVYILREAYSKYKNLCMLWSMGKDSTVLVDLAKKAFIGRLPFPVVHIDTGYKIPGMIEFRNRIAIEQNLDLIYGKNEDALASAKSYVNKTLSRIDCCNLLKTQTLLETLSARRTRYRLNHKNGDFELDTSNIKFNAVIVGIRSDEEGSRSKEKFFSIRDTDENWVPEEQELEIGYLFLPDVEERSIRIHPLLNWTETDVWEYIVREKIEVFPKYYDQGNNFRYRSLGCWPCTRPIVSTASNAKEVWIELQTGKYRNVAERAGREQDKEDGDSLEKLRRNGYM